MTADPKMTVFNAKPLKDTSPRSAVDLSKIMQKTMLRLKGEYMSVDGKGVDYKKIKDSKLFKEYTEEMAPQLQYVVLENISDNEKKAFFINIYNAQTIHGLVEQAQLPESVLKVQQFWKTTGYNIGGHVYSLDAIEHGILRGNRSHPASIHPEFTADDPRTKYVMKTLDPRIHFALVCGAKSCPAINVYTADNIDNALDAATKSFCRQEVFMFTQVDQIRLSRLFQWYSQDFGNTDIGVIKWIIPFLDKEEQDKAHVLLFKLDKIKPVDIQYSEYNWQLNIPQPNFDPNEIHPNDLMEMEQMEHNAQIPV